MDEAGVGITAFLSTAPGFSGLFKLRFSDFIVREVEPDGTVVRLRAPAHKGQVPPAAGVVSEESEARAALEQAVPAEELAALEALSRELDEHPRADAPLLLLHIGTDKAVRTAVHKAIRALFPLFSSETTEDGQAIRVATKKSARRDDLASRRAEQSGKRGVKRGRLAEEIWPGGGARYVHFVLVKENRDTMDVIENLARMLGCKPGVFGYAGVKDRRAVTVQRVSAYKILPDRLAGIEERASLGTAVRLGDLRYAEQPLRTGELFGNRFTIVLRAVPADEVCAVAEGARTLGARGFINYYGLQRFGNNPLAPTHHVGRALLCGRWREAIDMILAPRAGEKAAVHAAREAYARTREPADGLRLMPSFMHRERALLEGLQHDATNLTAVLGRLPRQLRLLYLHAYQSYVFNRVAVERLRLFGEAAVAGDLVQAAARPAETAGAAAPPADDAPEPPAADDDDAADGGELEGAAVAVRLLTEADVASGAFSIFDVLLPLPGTQVTYPAHAAGAYYATLMGADGLDPHDMARRVREYALAGGYRKLVVRPGELTHELITYTDPEEPLAVSDMDAIRAMDAPAPAPAVAAAAAPVAAPAAEPPTAAAPLLHGVRLEFTLPAGSYATMALRELCKRSTEIDNQIHATAAAAAELAAARQAAADATAQMSKAATAD